MAGFVEIAQVVLEILVPTAVVPPPPDTDPWLWVYCGNSVDEKEKVKGE
jgi:hypothetical protein